MKHALGDGFRFTDFHTRKEAPVSNFTAPVSLSVTAQSLAASGLSVIPCQPNKRPCLPWKAYQEAPPTPGEIEGWQHGRGFTKDSTGQTVTYEKLGVVTGAVSSGLTVVDVDCKYDLSGHLWRDLQNQIARYIPEFFQQMVVAKTVSGGYHIYLRCEVIAANQKLAQRPTTEAEQKGNAKDKVRVLIETRGEGGFVIAPPSDGYQWMQGNQTTIPVISADTYEALFEICKTFNEVAPKQKVYVPSLNGKARVGDDYNERADIADILAEAGWTLATDRSNYQTWKRPGDSDTPHSGYFYRDSNSFYCFSTSTALEAEKQHSPFALYAGLYHDYDFKEAAKSLAGQGYGNSQSFEPIGKNSAVDSLPVVGSGESMFITKTAREWNESAAKKPPVHTLFGNCFREKEVSLLFADTGSGKSVLAVQIGLQISSPYKFGGGLDRTGEPKRVLLLDFELSEGQFLRRFGDAPFNDHFLRAEMNPDAIPPDNFEEVLIQNVGALIAEHGAEVLIVDNLTFLRTETEKAKDALPLMKALKLLARKLDISMLLIGHTPKRDASRPITNNDLAGSKQLMNFLDSCFALGKSSRDSSLRYLKEIKLRDSEFTLDGDNVATLELHKPDGKDFLQFSFKGFESEYAHLKETPEEERKQLETDVLQLHTEGLSLREIEAKLGPGVISYSKAKRIIDRNK